MINFIIFLQVTVELFSKHQIQNLDFYLPNKNRIIINYNDDFQKQIKLPENTRVLVNKKHQKYIKGNIFIKKFKNQIKIYQILDFQDYVLSVVASEVHKDMPIEALKAFYLVVKNYSLKNLKRHKNHDFCDIAHCQLYYGNSFRASSNSFRKKLLSNKVQKKLKTVFNKAIFYKNKLISAVYSSSCGLMTCSSENIWGTKIPYLKSRKLNTSLDFWEYRIDKSKLHDLLKVSKILNKEKFDCLGIKTELKISSEKFRRIINHKFGWNSIKSNLFRIKSYKNYYIIEGYGFGHNVGFCIKEAILLAKQGLNYQQILEYFFKDISISDIKI